MRSFRGRSGSEDAAQAVAEATASWPRETPDLVLAFSSTKQDPTAVREALRARFGDALVVGCTSTGEIVDGAHGNGTLALAGLFTPEVRWSAQVMEGLQGFVAEDAARAVSAAYGALGVDPSQVDARELVAVLFIDGLSMREEVVAAAVSDALDGAALVGGSAGDDLAFKRTWVYGPQGVSTDAAVLLVGRGPAGFYTVIKHQHFTTRPVTLAVTRADPARRRVHELDGYPAAEAYARALGIPRASLGDATFLNPVLVTVQGQRFVRSVQSVNDDGSLTFYCAVDEGWILDLGGHHEMVGALRDDLAALRDGDRRMGFVLAFNCILRALEAEKKALHQDLQCVFADVADGSLGFDTYGETLDGLHINQTLVALGLRAAA